MKFTKKIDTISFDCWDTLLRRKLHPDQIKIFSHQRYMCLHGYTFQQPSIKMLNERQNWEREAGINNLKQGHDLEYEISEVFEKFSGLNQLEIEEQIRFEVNQELKLTYPDPTILVEFKNFIENRSIKKVIISDFYMDSPTLSFILSKNFPGIVWDETHVSCDFKKNKSNKLFPHLLEDSKFKSSTWIHVGDSIKADVESPQKYGIDSVHFLPPEETEKRLQKEVEFQARLSRKELFFLDNVSEQIKLALGLVGFMNEIRARASFAKQKVFFVEREGITFRSFFDQTENVYSLGDVQVDTLSVSRRALLPIAFATDPRATVKIFCKNYPHANGEQFLGSMGISYSNIRKYRSLELNLNDFLAIEENLSFIQEHCAIEFFNGKRYLDAKFDDLRNILLVDIGWHGTVQDLLTLIYPQLNFSGFYLGLKVTNSADPKKASFLDSAYAETKKILTNVRPVEMLFTPAEIQSVTGYGEDSTPIRLHDRNFPEVPQRFITLLKGINQSFPVANELFLEKAITLKESSELLSRSISQILSKPDKELLNEYLSVCHDETFGMNEVVEIGKQVNLFKLMFNFLTLNIAGLISIWHKIGWVEAASYKIFGFILPGWVRRLFYRVYSLKNSIQWILSLLRIKRVRKLLRIETLYLIKANKSKFYESVKSKGLKASVKYSLSVLTSEVFVGNLIVADYKTQAISQGVVNSKVLFVYDVFTNKDFEKIYEIYNRGIDVFPISATNFFSGSINLTRVEKIVVVDELFQVGRKYLEGTKLFDKCFSFSSFTSTLSSDSKCDQVIPPDDLRIGDVAWVIQGIPIGSGGHRQMFRQALEIAKLGFNPVFYFVNESLSVQEIKKRFREHYYEQEVRVVKGLPLMFEQQIIMATAPQVIDSIKERSNRFQKIFYLVQDDEALFNPVSTGYFKCRESLRDLDLDVIATGPWMAKRIEHLTGRKVFFFPFPVDKNVYRPGDQAVSSRKLLVYYKPESMRRMHETCLLVSSIVKQIVPDVEIVSFGSEQYPPENLGIKHLGQLPTLDDLADLYRSSRVALMFSPTNPSLLPYEMGARGLPTVDYFEPGDEAKDQFLKETAIVRAAPTSWQIARKIAEVLTNDAEYLKARSEVLNAADNFPGVTEVGDLIGQYMVSKLVN